VFRLRENNHPGDLLHFINLMLRADKRKTRIDCALFVHRGLWEKRDFSGAPSFPTAQKADQ